MSRRIDHSHSGDDVLAWFDGSEPVLDAREIALGAEHEASEILGHLVQGVCVHPEIPLSLGDEIARIRKSQLSAPVGYTPQMIRMRVGEDDLGDLFSVNSRRLQAVDELSRCRLPAAARAGERKSVV